MLGGESERSCWDNRNSPFTAIIAADESAGLDGSSGALKSLHSDSSDTWKHRLDQQYGPRNDPIRWKVGEEVRGHVSRSIKVIKVLRMFIHYEGSNGLVLYAEKLRTYY